MKWYERPDYIKEFYDYHNDDIKGYEKHFDWVNKKITYIIKYLDKSVPDSTFEYDFDGVKPNA